MDIAAKASLRRRVWFLIMVGAMLYVVVSAAIAIMTVDDCGNGDEGAPKHWSLFPPEWVCERQRF